ncbi:MAG: hypothetical protein JSW08_03040 [archaeon]|nr:MAG: hypothetical protein JSW08_03040 [archaeon]
MHQVYEPIRETMRKLKSAPMHRVRRWASNLDHVANFASGFYKGFMDSRGVSVNPTYLYIKGGISTLLGAINAAAEKRISDRARNINPGGYRDARREGVENIRELGYHLDTPEERTEKRIDQLERTDRLGWRLAWKTGIKTGLCIAEMLGGYVVGLGIGKLTG